MHQRQTDLFTPAPAVTSAVPGGLRHQPDLIDAATEAALIADIAGLPFKPFEFRGYLGARRVVSFGWRYDYTRRVEAEAAPIPAFLLPLRDAVAAFAALPVESFRQALVTEYAPGAGIGWHRDKPVFGEVAGVSLASACTLRFRREKPDGGWERRALIAEPRSAYLLQGPARDEWQHSIAPLSQLRYSVTFRRYPRQG